MGLDNMERGISLFAGAIAMILAAVVSPHLFKNTLVTDTVKHVKGKACPAGYHLVVSLCEKTHLTHPSAWLPQFLEILIVGLFIIFFALRRKRAGVAVCGLLLGLALGSVGLPFLFVGGWLVIRAFRLQKYGDASFSGSSRRARELGQARKEGRAPATRRTRGAKGATATKSAPVPAPSKRYTPKKPTRRG
jgi:hypothetical protein